MENKKLESDDDLEIIQINSETEPILVEESNPEEPKECKRKKKRKRKVKLGVDKKNHMETILVTQKLKVKRKKISCVININRVCDSKRRGKSNSILRFKRNECRKEAYYNRIVPACLRDRCSGKNNVNCRRCRSDRHKERKLLNGNKIKNGSFSPVSSLPLADDLPNFSISYEEVSTGEFSSFDELDTLIKRTKEREKQFEQGYSAPLFTSTPLPTKDDESTYSCDMSVESVASAATLVLVPLETQSYSPTPSKYDYDIPYSPTMTPEFMRSESFDEHPTSTYSPCELNLTQPRLDFSETVVQEYSKLEEDGTGICPYAKVGLRIKKEIDSENDNHFSDTATHDTLEKEEARISPYNNVSPKVKTEIDSEINNLNKNVKNEINFDSEKEELQMHPHNQVNPPIKIERDSESNDLRNVDNQNGVNYESEEDLHNKVGPGIKLEKDDESDNYILYNNITQHGTNSTTDIMRNCNERIQTKRIKLENESEYENDHTDLNANKVHIKTERF